MPEAAVATRAVSEQEFAALVEELKSDPARRELLTDLLREDNEIYDQRGTAATVRMRGWVLLAFARVGLPDAALVFVLEELDTGRDAYLVAAAARALRAYSAPSPAFAPFLMQAISNIRYRDEIVCLGRYGEYAMSPAGTTAIQEVLETLVWLGPHARVILSDLDALSARCDGLSGTVQADVARAAAAIRQAVPMVLADESCCDTVADLGRGWWPRRSRRDCEAIESLRFEDHDGAGITFGDLFRGRPSIVAFFYTRCDNPRKCSLTIAKLARLQQVLVDRGLADRIRTAAITYDPAYDLPPRLRAYGKNRGLRMDSDHRMLRAPGGLDALRAHFNLGVNFVASLVNRHRVELFILDAEGRVAASFERLSWDEPLVVDRAAALLDESRPVEADVTPGAAAPGRTAWVALGAIAPFGAAFFPKCPVCWATYLSVFGVAGLDRIPYSPWLLPLFAGLLLVNLGSLWLRGRSTRRFGGFYLAAAGAFAILILKMVFDLGYAGATGTALTLAGSLLGVCGQDLKQLKSH